MTRRILIPSLIFLAVLVFAVSSASASSPTVNLASSNVQALVPGNYCVSCHLADDLRLATVTEWKGGIAREVNSPCPAATKIHEELYYTERLLLMIDRAKDSVGVPPEKTQSRLDGYTQRYSRMLDVPVTSLDAFTIEAQSTRFQLNKVYSVLNNSAEAAKQRTVLIYAIVVTLVMLGSLAWGLYNTRFIKTGWGAPKAVVKPAAFVVVVLAFFIMPVFRVPAAKVVETTTEEQQAQAVLDTADRSAMASDRAQARAWMLARLGVAWEQIDSAQARAILDESMAAMAQVDENNHALWGQSLSVHEAMIGVPIDMEKADLVAVDLNAAHARLWSLPLIAIEWKALDPVHAAELLQIEQNALEARAGIYRDLQLRGVALAWVEIQPSMAVPAARSIEDASIRSWTLRELAPVTDDSSIFEFAIEAAREINEPVQRARALRELAVVSGDHSLFDEALAALDGVSDAPLAYALSELAVASGDVSLVERIDPVYPDARTVALLRLGEYQAAWDVASAIVDPYDQARAQAAIVGAWENTDAASAIEVPVYRDLALRDVTRKTGNLSLADSIQSPYYRVQALTALGKYDAAVDIAGELGNSYPLVELASVMAQDDLHSALLLVGQMSSEADKAVALKAIAAAANDQALFEQAQGMALAARVQGDALAPSQALFDLADVFWKMNSVNAQAALRQAHEAAQRISTK